VSALERVGERRSPSVVGRAILREEQPQRDRQQSDAEDAVDRAEDEERASAEDPDDAERDDVDDADEVHRRTPEPGEKRPTPKTKLPATARKCGIPVSVQT